jgi:DNA-binding NarL/FixJ family response regulator
LRRDLRDSTRDPGSGGAVSNVERATPGAVAADQVSAAPLRVIVCDDQAIVREGVTQILRDAGFDVVATAADAPELVRKARAHRPDVVVTDIRIPPGSVDDAVRATRTIRSELPDTAVLVLSQDIEGHYARDLVGEHANGVGYLLKQHVADLTTLTDAVRRVAGGGSALDPDVVQHLVSDLRDDDPLSRLTPKEHCVLALMAEGRSNQSIADELVVTVAAVERHVTSIFSKLDLHQTPDQHRRVMAVLRYLRT